MEQEREEVHNESASNGMLPKEAEEEARKRTLSDATVPTLIINGDFAR